MIPQNVHNIPPHLNSQSLRRSRSRPSPGSGGHYQTPDSVVYQQPYLGRNASHGLSDSPTSDNASDATLTDSELPISNQNALPLQNGGLLMGGNLDFSTASGKLNSLKRNINSNGKLVNHTGNHDNLIDQFVMHTSGGKIYIPQDTPKNSTSDYKTSPSNSPTKKISSSLLYKDAVNMSSLRDGRSISKSDEDDCMYKVKRFCWPCNKSLAIVLIFFLGVSLIVNILFGIGALPFGGDEESDSAKCCVQGVTRLVSDANRDSRQSSSSTTANGSHSDKSSSSSAGAISNSDVDDEKLGNATLNKTTGFLHADNDSKILHVVAVAVDVGDDVGVGVDVGMGLEQSVDVDERAVEFVGGGRRHGGGGREKSDKIDRKDRKRRLKRSINQRIRRNSNVDDSTGIVEGEEERQGEASSNSNMDVDVNLHATQDGVNEMVTSTTSSSLSSSSSTSSTSTSSSWAITEGMEEVHEYPDSSASSQSSASPSSSSQIQKAAVSPEENGKDFDEISETWSEESQEAGQAGETEPTPPPYGSPISISPSLPTSTSSSRSTSTSSSRSGPNGNVMMETTWSPWSVRPGPEKAEEIADDSTHRNIFNLIQVVSQKQEPEQNTWKTEEATLPIPIPLLIPVVNGEETARKMVEASSSDSATDFVAAAEDDDEDEKKGEEAERVEEMPSQTEETQDADEELMKVEGNNRNEEEKKMEQTVGVKSITSTNSHSDFATATTEQAVEWNGGDLRSTHQRRPDERLMIVNTDLSQPSKSKPTSTAVPVLDMEATGGGSKPKPKPSAADDDDDDADADAEAEADDYLARRPSLSQPQNSPHKINESDMKNDDDNDSPNHNDNDNGNEKEDENENVSLFDSGAEKQRAFKSNNNKDKNFSLSPPVTHTHSLEAAQKLEEEESSANQQDIKLRLNYLGRSQSNGQGNGENVVVSDRPKSFYPTATNNENDNNNDKDTEGRNKTHPYPEEDDDDSNKMKMKESTIFTRNKTNEVQQQQKEERRNQEEKEYEVVEEDESDERIMTHHFYAEKEREKYTEKGKGKQSPKVDVDTDLQRDEGNKIAPGSPSAVNNYAVSDFNVKSPAESPSNSNADCKGKGCRPIAISYHHSPNLNPSPRGTDQQQHHDHDHNDHVDVDDDIDRDGDVPLVKIVSIQRAHQTADKDQDEGTKQKQIQIQIESKEKQMQEKSNLNFHKSPSFPQSNSNSDSPSAQFLLAEQQQEFEFEEDNDIKPSFENKAFPPLANREPLSTRENNQIDLGIFPHNLYSKSNLNLNLNSNLKQNLNSDSDSNSNFNSISNSVHESYPFHRVNEKEAQVLNKSYNLLLLKPQPRELQTIYIHENSTKNDTNNNIIPASTELLISTQTPSSLTTIKTTMSPPESESNFGGVCQCFCPCLANMGTNDDSDDEDDDDGTNDPSRGLTPSPSISLTSTSTSASPVPHPPSSSFTGNDDSNNKMEEENSTWTNIEDEDFIVVRDPTNGSNEGKSAVVRDEWIELGSGSGSGFGFSFGSSSETGSGSGSESRSGQQKEGKKEDGDEEEDDDQSSTVTDFHFNVYTDDGENQYSSFSAVPPTTSFFPHSHAGESDSSLSSFSAPLTTETITMDSDSVGRDNNRVSPSAEVPRRGLGQDEKKQEKQGEAYAYAYTENSIVTQPLAFSNTVDELRSSSSSSSSPSTITPSSGDEMEESEEFEFGEDEQFQEEDSYNVDDNKTIKSIVPKMGSTNMTTTENESESESSRENSLAGNTNGIPKKNKEPGNRTQEQEQEEAKEESFEWIQCACSRQVGKNYEEKTVEQKPEPGVRTFPAVNFPPDGTSFAQIVLGSRLSNIIGAYSYWNMQFYQSEGAYVTWEMSVPRGSSVGFYARRNALPTHTHYDFMEILRGFKARSKRSSPPSVTKEVSKFIEQGHWFLSLYNDDSDPQEVIFASSISEEMTEGCPNGCSGNGQCQMGRCQCNAGFGSDDCSQSICPVLCSGRGEYVNGVCKCNPGYKGVECNLRHDECEVSDCSLHGKCVNGKCVCQPRWTGPDCSQADCIHPTCSGHGFCHLGNCLCKKGWRGADCSQADSDALQCLPDCSNHGVFNLETQTCSCEPRFTGEDCSQELCDTNCGPNGICIGGGCKCDEGFTGPLCNLKVCDKRCGDHGQCKNGTCLCVTGWNGKHCTLEGCPNSCSGHGQCKANYEGLWECKCHNGWTGSECSVMMEQNCNDGKDNDKDGLTDCEDPECCSVAQCEKSQLCVSARKPIDILLRKQPPAITASFFEKMKFLIEDGSLQSYARQDAFNGSRSGVVRGRIVTPNGSGLMGVRVSSTSPLEPLGGFTLTQDDGWFDLMVNGGGAVTLHFGRSPFNPQTRTIFVPWNEVVIIDTVIMGSTDVDDRLFNRRQVSCDSHDYETMKPIVLATWKHGFQGDCPETSTILVESQVVQESIRIPGSGLHLMYHSSRVQGYLSTIQLQLTAETIPAALKRVHLRITIEGVLFEKIFEADPGIRFTYAWNRLNVYRQRVYGVTTAIVKVGYEYNNCANVIWDVQSTTLSGQDMSISDIGGWNLDIHHRYNFHEGIIQKGDGSNIYLKHRPRVIITAMGNGYQRSLDCGTECNGIASKQRLLAPVALQAGPDGTVFVGDFDLIRRLMVDGTVHNIVKLNATRVSYRYHMALSPVDNILYISDPESHQIIRVRDIEDGSNPEHNWEPVVGSGERCLPGDEAHCGDEALARDAKLAYPKGVAVSSDNVLYFADGTNIRKVDRDGIITTVIGNHQQKSHWKPIPCEGTLKVEEVHLRWPTELAVNPLDNSLYIIDDHMILKLTDDNRIRIIAGRPFHCAMPTGGYDLDLATHTALISPQSMTFASNGDLYVAESDSQRINRVRLVTTDGRISHFAGAESKCNCLDQGCSCFEDDFFLAATSKFNTISAVCMTPDGVLHVADQGNNRIRSIMASIPSSTPSESRQYEIYSTETQEIYVFNRFGQHIATKNIVTGETVYTFVYNVNMSNGKLSSVTDTAGNKIQILRDYSSQVKTIENSQAQKFNLKMSRVRMLQEFSTPEGYNLTFDYHGSNGLVKSRQDSSGRSSVYSYDEFGRLTMAVSPTGQVVTLTFDLSVKGASVKVTRDENYPQSVLIKGSTIYKRQGKTEEITSVHPDGSVVRTFPWAQTITTETVPYNVLGDINPILSDSFPIPGKQRTELAGDLVNRVEWRYVPRKEGRGKNKQLVQIDKKMRINGENVLMIEYDRETKSEIVFTDDRNQMLNVSFDRAGRPSKWAPSRGYAPVELEYDRFGRLIGWKWDDLTEIYEYDRSGRLFKIDYTDGTSLTHTFRDLMDNLPMKMTTAGGSDYLLEYDASGAFQSLTTPRGHIHNFGISTSIGAYEYVYKAPSSRDVYKIQYNDLGQIATIIYPQASGRVNYVYNKYNKLDAYVAGLRSARFLYQENTGLLKVADVFQSSFEIKIEYKYHGGIIKEQREKYGSTTGLDNVHLKYQYDGNARISSIEAEVNGKNIQGLSIRKNQNTGMIETIQDLTIYRTINGDNFNRTLVQDASKTYQKIVETDRVGRLRRSRINLKGVEVFKLDIDYDSRGKIKHRKMAIAKSAYADNVIYDADGHVSEVMGSGNWKYVFDENGNTIQIVEQGEKSSLIYDSGDRVIQVGELFRYTYDPRGFLVQRGSEKFQYDDKGLLLHAVKKDVYKVWFFYDHTDRLVSWKDDQGNVTQFLYANPETPHLITHVHFPFWGKHYLLLYDQSEALIGLISSDSLRYYVATDQHRSPLALFNAQGSVVKEIHRTPFGRVVRDTNLDFYLPLDYYGGVVDRHTGIVIIKGRPYDPSIGQWMTPNWETLSATLKNPTDIFSYRFSRNDPITPRSPFVESKMTSLKDWLKLYGYDMNRIFGQDYVSPIQMEPSVSQNPHLVPEFRAVTGLDCIATTVTKGFKTLDFRRGSRLKTERLLSGNSEWDLMSKIAYRRAAFGPGLLISRIEHGKTLISTVDNSVVQGVITSVLNGSLSIDFKSTHQNTFYFVKDNPHKLRDDMEELKRLGGLYNISVHDADGIKELRLSTGDVSVAVRYGADGSEEYGRLIKHAHRRAIEKAWEEEKMYISMGLDGRRLWTEEEKDQLLSKGQVHGYRPVDLYSVHKYPQLADDPSNVVFQRDARRKRRKSNKRHHEHSSSLVSLLQHSTLSSSLSSSSSIS